jgi:acetoin utilization deacetylase AcuC-like enzyme
MLPIKLIYHEDYDLHLGAHIFPSHKYRLIYNTLLEEKLAEPADFLEPVPASDEDVMLVHTREWVRKLRQGKLTLTEVMRLEVPYSQELVNAFWLAAGGSILAGRRALADGLAVNVGGGFHHAFSDHGEGFCAINDVAIAIRVLQRDSAIQTAMVVDTDVHQGNGTAAIFENDDRIFTLSIHQEHNYPAWKPPSKIDIHLRDGTGDEDYLARLEKHLIQAFHDFSPDIVFYVGGADPYREDQLGGLALTIDGLKHRDLLVYEHARRHRVPVAVTLAGGYARRIEDTVRIHINTILAAADCVARTTAQKLRS